jgi:hypothetical protein
MSHHTLVLVGIYGQGWPLGSPMMRSSMLYTNDRGLTVLSVGAYEKILFSCIICEVLGSLACRASVGRYFAYRGDFPSNAHTPRHDFIEPFDIGVPENCSSMEDIRLL